MRRVLPVAVVLALVLLAAGCGSKESSDASSTEAWVNGVCTSITTWKDSVTAAGQSLQGGDLSKASIQSAADDAKEATDTLRSDLKDLGKPDTDSGQQAKDLVDQLATDLNADIDSLKQAADNASGGLGLIGAAAAAATTLGTMRTQLTTALDSLRQLDAKGELQSAFEQSSACKPYSGSG